MPLEALTAEALDASPLEQHAPSFASSDAPSRPIEAAEVSSTLPGTLTRAPPREDEFEQDLPP